MTFRKSLKGNCVVRDKRRKGRGSQYSVECYTLIVTLGLIGVHVKKKDYH